MDSKFERDTFLLHQRARPWHDRWRIYDDHEVVLLDVERPDRWFGRNQIYVYTDESRTKTVLSIIQTGWFQILRKSHVIYDCLGTKLAILSRGSLGGFFHHGWDVADANGVVIARIREVSPSTALFKRAIHMIPFTRLFTGGLPLNFDIVIPAAQDCAARIGSLGTQYGIPGKYVLDLARDKGHRLDRRVVLAAAVLINMGSSR